jgi:two-component system, OmpR family, phosphate regulon response regulator PhoB
MTTDTSKKGTVLVVEDDPDFSEFLCETLRDDGYEIEAVLDGAEVFEKARELQPAAITLDILMPGQTGIALYRQLRKDDETKSIPVIIISGVGTEGKKLKISRFFEGRTIPDPEGVMQKPIEPEALIQTINAVLGHAA